MWQHLVMEAAKDDAYLFNQLAMLTTLPPWKLPVLLPYNTIPACPYILASSPFSTAFFFRVSSCSSIFYSMQVLPKSINLPHTHPQFLSLAPNVHFTNTFLATLTQILNSEPATTFHKFSSPCLLTYYSTVLFSNSTLIHLWFIFNSSSSSPFFLSISDY
jgi:hypothetical protein